MGLSADTMLPDYVVTEESLGNIGELRGETGPLRLPSNLIEMEAYLAARLNPLLHEVLIFTQHEGIPPALQGNVEKTLKLFGENDIDVGDRKEAEAYLTYLMNRDIHDYRRPHRLNTSWEEAHEVYDQNVEDIDSHPTVEKYRSLIQTTYGVSLTRAEGEGNAPWDLLRVRMVQVGLEMAATAVGDMASRNGLDWDDITAFRRIIGDIELRLTSQPHDKGALAEVYGPIITFYSNGYPFPNLLLHELGHVFNANVGLGDRDHLSSINYTKGHPDTWTGLGGSDPDGLGFYEALGLTEGDKLVSDVEDMVLRLQQSWDPETNEYTADGFLNWVFYRNSLGVLGFTDTDKGKEWQAFMHDNMYAWLRNAIVFNALRDNSNIPFYLEHDKILGYFGLATVRNYDEVIVRTEHSTAGDDSTVAGTLTREDEVAVIGQAVGEIHDNPRGSWTAIIWNGRKRWVASELLNLPQSTAPTVGVDDPFFTFDASHFSASGWQFFFDLVQYLDKGVGNAN